MYGITLTRSFQPSGPPAYGCATLQQSAVTERHTGMSKPTRVLHAGLHKTGSTFLQKDVFPKLENCAVFHGYHFHKGTTVDPEKPPASILFTSEGSCGTPYPITPTFSPERLLSNVEALQIDKVFIVKRDLHEWILSMYMQTLKAEQSWSLQEYIGRNAAALQTWDTAPEQLGDALSKRSVDFAVFRHEDLVTTPQETCNQICNFIGVPPVTVQSRRVNPGLYGTYAIRYIRALNYLGNLRPVKAFYRLFNIRSGRTMTAKSGRLGYMLDKRSRTRITSNDVTRLLAAHDQ